MTPSFFSSANLASARSRIRSSSSADNATRARPETSISDDSINRRRARISSASLGFTVQVPFISVATRSLERGVQLHHEPIPSTCTILSRSAFLFVVTIKQARGHCANLQAVLPFNL
jgi:hypothetical protein